ncbi:MAG: hypothetical protein ACR65R_21085 [Methylomicrobium sp.]
MNLPSFPKQNSLEATALGALLTGHRLSHLDFQGQTDSYCLRSSIFNLRNKGWLIEDCWHTGYISRSSGQRTRFKSYFIREAHLKVLRQRFGERLEHFITTVQALNRSPSPKPDMKKPARCANTEQAIFIKLQNHSTPTPRPVKPEFLEITIRLMVRGE